MKLLEYKIDAVTFMTWLPDQWIALTVCFPVVRSLLRFKGRENTFTFDEQQLSEGGHDLGVVVISVLGPHMMKTMSK